MPPLHGHDPNFQAGDQKMSKRQQLVGSDNAARAAIDASVLMVLAVDSVDPCDYSEARDGWVQPLPMPAGHSTVRVRFTLTNDTDGETSGRVRATLGPTQFIDNRQQWRELVATNSCYIKNLQPGKSASGEFWMYGRDSGSYTLELTYEVSNPDARPVITVSPAGTVIVSAIGGVETLATTMASYLVLPPRTILTTGFVNPAGRFGACGGSTYEGFGMEWAPIANDYAAVSGTAVNPDLSTKDLPFTHPFGFDYEFYVSPDPGSDSTRLLAPSNIRPQDGEYQSAFDAAVRLLRDPNSDLPEGDTSFVPGILGVETDDGLIPDVTADVERRLRPLHGDRVVVYGEWIEDCGHDDFHAEIHRPVLVIRAHTPKNANGDLLYDETRSSIVCRPYAPLQTFDGLPLANYFISQLVPLSLGLMRPEAKCDFAAKPFQGAVDLTYTVTPSSPRLSDKDRLEADYYLVVRNGVTVDVEVKDVDQGDEVLVHLVMDGDNYQPAPLVEPYVRRFETAWTQELLEKLGSPAASIYKTAQKIYDIASVAGAALLYGGIVMDCYVVNDPTTLPVLDRNGRVASIIVNDNQPYPVYGWVTARWSRESARRRARRRLDTEDVTAASPLMNRYITRYLTPQAITKLTGPTRNT
jgi:hypothetical protein